MTCQEICAECVKFRDKPIGHKNGAEYGLSQNLCRMREFRDRPIGHKNNAEWPVTESVWNARIP